LILGYGPSTCGALTPFRELPAPHLFFFAAAKTRMRSRFENPSRVLAKGEAAFFHKQKLSHPASGTAKQMG
jgi:hypothetical protein